MDQEQKVKVDLQIELKEIEQLRQRLDLAAGAVSTIEIVLTAHAQMLFELCNLDSRFKAIYESYRAEIEEKLTQLAAAQ